MKKSELKNKLESMNVPRHLYHLENYGITDQKLCLIEEEGKWIVFYSERGDRLLPIAFNTEDEACEEFYNRINSRANK